VNALMKSVLRAESVLVLNVHSHGTFQINQDRRVLDGAAKGMDPADPAKL